MDTMVTGEGFRALIENISDAIVVIDAAGIILYTSPSLTRLLGYASDELPGTSGFAIVHPNDHRILKVRLRTLFNDPASQAGAEFRVKAKDGAWRWMEGHATNRLGDPSIGGIVATFRDITARKRDDEEHRELMEREHRMRTEAERGQVRLALLAEASDIFSSSLDVQQTLSGIAQLTVPVLADMCMIALAGESGMLHIAAVACSNEEKCSPAQRVLDRYPPEPSSPYGLYNVLRTGAPGLYTEITDEMLRRIARNEEHLHLLHEAGLESAIVVPLSARGSILGILAFISLSPGTHYGVIDLRLAEELARRTAMAVENARLYLSLESEIAERRRAQEELLRHAADLARSNAELEDFAYLASHDLQEPLRKIQIFGDRVMEKHAALLPEEGREQLARMQSAAHRMSRLIDDLLTFSRITTDAKPFSPTDLHAVVREVLSDLELQIEQAGATVTVNALPVIDADPIQMHALFQNLLSNALKFHSATPPRIFISCELLCDPGSGERQPVPRCRFFVIDNGIGFDERYLDRIFTIFQRLHGRSQYEGSGIGLAVCRKIVERHGGSITARSKPGEGATFIATLPLHQSREGRQA